jgi:hypothetical protein
MMAAVKGRCSHPARTFALPGERVAGAASTSARGLVNGNAEVELPVPVVPMTTWWERSR